MAALSKWIGSAIVVLIPLALTILVTLQVGDHFIYSLASDRDFGRAVDLPRVLQITGPEIAGGIRIPGGAFYYFLYVLTRISESPVVVQGIAFLVHLTTLLVLTLTAKRYAGLLGAVVAAAFYGLSPAVVGSLAQLSALAFAPLFVIVMIAAALRVAVDDDQRYLPAVWIAAGLGVQIHPSIYALLAAALLVILIWYRRAGYLYWLVGLAGFLVCFTPYLLADGGKGLPVAVAAVMALGGGAAAHGNDAWISAIMDFIASQIGSGVDINTFVNDFQSMLSDPLGVGPELAAIAATDLFSAAMVVASIAVILRQIEGALTSSMFGVPSNPDAARAASAAVAVATIGFVGLLLLGIFGGANPIPNSVLAIAPFALFFGGAFGFFIGGLLGGERRRILRLLSVGILGIFCVVSFVRLYHEQVRAIGTAYPHSLTYSALRTMIDVGRQRYQLSDQELTSNIAVVVHTARLGWRVNAGGGPALAYLLGHDPAVPRGINRPVSANRPSTCVVVIDRSLSDGDLAAPEILQSLLPGGTNETISLAGEASRPSLSFIGYVTKSAKCLGPKGGAG